MDYKAERKIIKGKLSFEASLHIGSGEEGDWIDSTIIKTKEGKPFVPATTIAGVFRELAEKNFPQGDVEKLFGYVKKTENNLTESCASRLIFCDAFLSNESKSGYRNGVGIRRDSLTSREGALFSLETVEKPTFDFKLIIDNPCDSDMNILEPILAEFQSGRVAIGADKSRGLGWLKLSHLEVADINFADLNSFVDYLLYDEIKFKPLKINKSKTDGDDNYIEIEYTLTLEDVDASLIVSSGVPGFSEDADQTLMRDKEECGRFFIPGSSIKGPLRAQAERIVRFLNGNNKNSACDPTDSNGSCSAKVKEIKKQNKEIDLSMIKSCSCLICKTFGNGYLASKVFFADAYDNANQNIQIVDNVAIDRFTGGALKGAKFNTEVATKVNLKGKIILKDIEDWQTGLIAFVIRDWMMGDIRIGFGKMKGYGRCKVNLKKIALCWQDDNWLNGKIKENNIDNNGFYNRVVLEGNSQNLIKYKSDLEELINQVKDKVKK